MYLHMWEYTIIGLMKNLYNTMKNSEINRRKKQNAPTLNSHSIRLKNRIRVYCIPNARLVLSRWHFHIFFLIPFRWLCVSLYFVVLRYRSFLSFIKAPPPASHSEPKFIYNRYTIYEYVWVLSIILIVSFCYLFVV